MNADEALDQLAAVHELFVETLERCEHKDLVTLAFGELGVATVANRDQLGEAALAEAFEVVERLLGDGDEPTKNAVATGFLEAVVSSLERADLKRCELGVYFGPLAVAYIKSWDEFCEVEAP